MLCCVKKTTKSDIPLCVSPSFLGSATTLCFISRHDAVTQRLLVNAHIYSTTTISVSQHMYTCNVHNVQNPSHERSSEVSTWDECGRDTQLVSNPFPVQNTFYIQPPVWISHVTAEFNHILTRTVQLNVNASILSS